MNRAALRTLLTPLLTIAAMPLCFVGILAVWTMIERAENVIRVARFSAAHQDLVSDSLANPRVREFSLMPDPDDPATLLVRFDVEDKATYEKLESELHLIHNLEPELPWRWETNIRSGEKLGNDLGAMAEGASIAVKAVERLLIVFVASILLPLLVVYLTRPVRRPEF